MEMTRFLFTIQDAVDTVLGAAYASEGGEVFIPEISSYGMSTIVEAVSQINGSEVSQEMMGLRPGEKLHEDMLAETELPFTHVVPRQFSNNLLCVRPQYTSRQHSDNWDKYTGPHFNSALHVSDNVQELIDLVRRGYYESEGTYL